MENFILAGGFALFLLSTICGCYSTRHSSKEFVKNFSNIFLSIILMMISLTVIIIMVCEISYKGRIDKLEQKITEIEQHQNIMNQTDEIDYSVMEIDSITGDIIYRQCSIDVYN